MRAAIILLVVSISLLALGYRNDIYAPEIEQMSEDELWQTYNEAVATDMDLILERQRVLNEKLDKILELLRIHFIKIGGD